MQNKQLLDKLNNMKKQIALLVLLGVVAACGGSQGNETKVDDKQKLAATSPKEPQYTEGLELIAQSDC